MSYRLPCAAADSGRLASIFNLQSDWTAGTTILALLASGPSPMRIVRYIAIFLGGDDFLALPSLSSPLSPPLMRAASRGFHIWLDGRHRGSRVPRTDIKRHANRAVFRDFLDFSQRRRFLASLVAPVAAADASCLAWISDLTGRQEPRRPSSVDRHQAPCKSRGISRSSQRRRFLALSPPPLSPPQGVKSPRAPLDARSSGVGISCVYESHLKRRCVAFQRATSGLHRAPLSASPASTLHHLHQPCITFINPA